VYTPGAATRPGCAPVPGPGRSDAGAAAKLAADLAQGDAIGIKGRGERVRGQVKVGHDLGRLGERLMVDQFHGTVVDVDLIRRRGVDHVDGQRVGTDLAESILRIDLDRINPAGDGRGDGALASPGDAVAAAGQYPVEEQVDALDTRHDHRGVQGRG